MDGDFKCKTATFGKLVAMYPYFVVIARTHAIEAIDLDVNGGGFVMDRDAHGGLGAIGPDRLCYRIVDERRYRPTGACSSCHSDETDENSSTSDQDPHWIH